MAGASQKSGICPLIRFLSYFTPPLPGRVCNVSSLNMKNKRAIPPSKIELQQ